ncbi:MAG: hypothetical protein EB084_24585, partial [Proteobacteria bacterium]|nr:hypothetical protein [Pseudomonadota bacterium]
MAKPFNAEVLSSVALSSAAAPVPGVSEDGGEYVSFAFALGENGGKFPLRHKNALVVYSRVSYAGFPVFVGPQRGVSHGVNEPLPRGETAPQPLAEGRVDPLPQAHDVPQGRALPRFRALSHYDRKQAGMVLGCFREHMRPTSNSGARGNQVLRQDSGRVGFCVRFDQAYMLAEGTVQGFLPQLRGRKPCTVPSASM